MKRNKMAVVYIGLLFSVLLASLLVSSQVEAFHKNGPVPIPGDLVFHKQNSNKQSVSVNNLHGMDLIPITK